MFEHAGINIVLKQYPFLYNTENSALRQNSVVKRYFFENNSLPSETKEYINIHLKNCAVPGLCASQEYHLHLHFLHC